MLKVLGVTFILSTIFLVGCGKEISKEFLVVSNGKFYEKGSHEPYSGTVLFDNPISWGVISAPIVSGAKVSCTTKIKDGVYDGPVSCKDENTGNLVMELSFNNGKQDGKRTVFNSRTKDFIQVQNFENGVLNGEEQLYLDGKKLCETEYKNGKRHGKQVCWGAAESNAPSTGGSAFHRVKIFKDDEKTIDAFFENGEIKNGIFTSFTPMTNPAGGWSALVTQQEFLNGKRDGKMEAFKLSTYESTDRIPFAIGKFKNGIATENFTYYAQDGKSICVEKTYDNGTPVSGFLNRYSRDDDFSSQIKLVKHDTINAFVLDGNEKIVKKYREERDTADCAFSCKTTENTWAMGVILKSVTTDYGRNFGSVENIATQELIKESVMDNSPAGLTNINAFYNNSAAHHEFCDDTAAAYGSDIVVINHRLYTSSIVRYENNVPKEQITCPYGATDATYAGTAMSMGVGCTDNSRVTPDNSHATSDNQEQKDCQIDISDLAVSVFAISAEKEGAGTKLTLNYTNSSENHYEVPVVKVTSCQLLKGPNDFKEITAFKPADSLPQHYLCDSTFDPNNISVKIYAKQDGDVTATSACEVVKI